MAVIQMDESYLLGGWFASALWGVSCHAFPYLPFADNSSNTLHLLGGYTVLFGTSLYLILAHKRHELKRITTWIMCIMCVCFQAIL